MQSSTSFEAGVTHVTAVDASAPYLNAAREEGQRREHVDRATYLHGDFVHLADLFHLSRS